MIDVRQRVTRRINRARLALELRRAVPAIGVLAVGGLVGLACWGFLLSNIAETQFVSSRQVPFAVDDASGVVAGLAKVRFKGIEVGRVTKVEVVNGEALVTAEVKTRYGPIYRDATAVLRPTTALQDMFLDITDRGTAEAGAPTARRPVAANQTDVSERVAHVLSVFQPGTRARLAALLDGLGGGLAGRGTDLREAFVKLAPFLQVAGRMSKELAERSAMTRRIVRDLALLTGELDRRDRALHRLISDGAVTLGTLRAGSADLDATLRELPRFLEQTESSFAALQATLPAVDGALRALRPAADRLPAGLTALERLAIDARSPLTALRTPVRRLVPLARALPPLSGNLRQASSDLLPQRGDIATATRDLARCSIALYGFFQFTPSITKYQDERGIFPRGDAIMRPDDAPGGEPREFAAPGCAPGMPRRGTP